MDRGMKDNEVCPLCGGNMVEWNMGIYECEDCENMIDIEVINEILGGEEGW